MYIGDGPISLLESVDWLSSSLGAVACFLCIRTLIALYTSCILFLLIQLPLLIKKKTRRIIQTFSKRYIGGPDFQVDKSLSFLGSQGYLLFQAL